MWTGGTGPSNATAFDPARRRIYALGQIFSYVYGLGHTYQAGAGTTNFDFVKQGGQEILFPFQRFQANIGFGEVHSIRFLEGSAKGTSEYPNKFWTQSTGKYTSNYLGTLTVTLGARLKL